MYKLRFFSSSVLCLIFAIGIQAREYNILDFGAIPDGKTINTEIIQKVINLASEAGGGKIVVPVGIFLTGSLELKSNIHLFLTKGAILLGSSDPYLYQKMKTSNISDVDKRDFNSQMALLTAYKADNITISGNGKIDGQGRELALNIDSLHRVGKRIDPNYNIRNMRPNETVRPYLFYFSTCNNIDVSGVELKNSACWGLVFELCHRLKINAVRVFNRAYWNNDGIDILDCSNVSITNCDINSGDDAICFKSYYPKYANDSIYIANCTVRTSTNAIKLGTASYGGFRNITVNNIKIYDTNRSAIAIESVDGAEIKNLEVGNVKAENVRNEIFIRLGHRGGKETGSVKNVYIHDVKAQIAFGRADINYDMRGHSINFPHNPFPASITGIPGYKAEDIRIENVEITYPGRASKGMAYIPLNRLSSIPEQIANYPEHFMFRELPAWGFYIRHAKNIVFKNVVLNIEHPDFRPPFVLDDVTDVTFNQLTLPENSSNIVIRKCSKMSHDVNLESNFVTVN